MALRLVSSAVGSATKANAFNLARATTRNFSGGSGNTLVIAEHDDQGNYASGTLSTITAASKLGSVTVLVAGSNAKAASDKVAGLTGVTKVLSCTNDALAHGIPENLAPVIKELQDAHSFSHILAPATAFGKNLIPRVGAKLDVQPISDISEIKSENTFVRPIYAGDALLTVESTDSVKLITVRGTAFEKAAEGGSGSVEEITAAAAADAETKWESAELTKSDRPELTAAGIVVAGGRGLKSSEEFDGQMNPLADACGAAIGASRAAVDAGYAPNDMQIGQTGKIVAPELYLAFGISGAVQHLAGMKDSKTIVCVNKDPDAPLFAVSDFGIVGDLFTIVPELTEKLK